MYNFTLLLFSLFISTNALAQNCPHIGEDIRITVLGVDDNQVRIGINAPKEVPVHREEIYYKIKFENEQKGIAVSVDAESEGHNENRGNR